MYYMCYESNLRLNPENYGAANSRYGFVIIYYVKLAYNNLYL